MRKLFCTIMVVASVMLALPAQAQIKFGVKAGVNLNKASFSSDAVSKNYTGFYVGPMAEVSIPFLGFGVDGALLYSQKGIDTETANASTVLVKEVTVPLNLKYTLGSSLLGLYFAVGPQFAFNLDKNADDGNGGHNYSFKTSNISMNFGVGVKMINHLQVSATYNVPCGKTADFEYNNTGKYLWNAKTKGWMLGLSYLF